jgi:hypothetical protein
LLQIPPKESVKLKKSVITFTYLTLFRKIQRTKGETAERAAYSSFKTRFFARKKTNEQLAGKE